MKRLNKFVLVLSVVLLSVLAVSCFDSSSAVENRAKGTVEVVFSNKENRGKAITVSNTNYSSIYGAEDNCYWRYTAVMDGNSLAAGTQTSETPVKTTSETGLGEVGGFESGKWTFTLFAYEDSSFTKLLYQSSEIKATLQVNSPALQLNFPVSKVMVTGQKGGIRIVTSGSNAISFKGKQASENFTLEDVGVSKDGSAVTTLTDANSYCDDNLEPGSYLLNIKFVYQGIYYSASTRVRVYSNFISEVIGELEDREYCEYTLTYMDKGGSEFSGGFVGSEPKFHMYGEDTVLPQAVKDYYNFNGWSTDSNWTTSITCIPAEVYEDTTVYAKWTPITYTIDYNFNAIVGSAKDPDLDEKNILTSYSSFSVETPTFTVPEPERTGFTFNGWSTGTDSSTTMSSLVITKGSFGDREYKANWREHTYTIRFDQNTTSTGVVGFDMPDITGVNYSDKKNLPSLNCTLSDQLVFRGWSYTKDGRPSKSDGAQVEKLTSTDFAVVTLYAVWQKEGDTTYTVLHFFENLDDSEYSLYETEELHGEMDSLGFATPKSEAGFTYCDDKSTSSDLIDGFGNTVLEMYYTRNVHTLTWDLNGGSTFDVFTTNGDYKFETPLTSPSSASMEREGYTFNGWDKEIPVTMPDSNVELKALWLGKPYTVHFDKNDSVGSTRASGITADMGRTYDETKTPLRDNGFVRDGYTFTAWGTSVNGGTLYTTYTAYNNFSTGTDVTLYAQWKANEYKVVFDKNKGTGSSEVKGSTSSQNRVFDETDYALSDNGYYRDGYTFTGWNTSSDGSGSSYPDSKVCNNLTTATDDVVLYAQWEANTYTVSFEKNKGDGSTTVNGSTAEMNRVYDDEAVLLSTNGFSRDGYTFTGWNTASDGTGTSYTTSTTYTNLSTGTDVKLYAQWSADTYTLTLNPNNGFATTETTATFDSSVITPFTVESSTDTDLVFMGYCTATTETNGVMVITSASCLAKDVSGYTDAEGKWIRTEGAVLYAIWHKNLSPSVYASTIVNLSFDSDAKFIATPQVKTGLKMKKDDTRVPYDVSQVTCIGKDYIIGFYTDTTFENKVLNGDGSVVTSTDVEGYVEDGKWACTKGEVTLYARWVSSSEGELVIKFNSNGGTGSMNDMTVPTPCTSAVALKANTFSNFGKTFIGWNTKEDGTGSWYGDSYKSSAWEGTELTLYAQWGEVSANYFIPVNYLESHGKEWIDLGITPTEKTKSQIDFKFLTPCGGVILGYFKSGDSADYRFFVTTGSTTYNAYFDTPFASSNRIIASGACTIGNRYRYEIGNYYIKDMDTGSNLISGTEFGSFTAERTMTLLRNDYGNYCGSEAIYSLRIYEDGVKVLELIPCKLKSDISVSYAVDGKEHSKGNSVSGIWFQINSTATAVQVLLPANLTDFRFV